LFDVAIREGTSADAYSGESPGHVTWAFLEFTLYFRPDSKPQTVKKKKAEKCKAYQEYEHLDVCTYCIHHGK